MSEEVKREAEGILLIIDNLSGRTVSQVNRFLLPEIRAAVAGIAAGDPSQAAELKRILQDAEIPEGSNSDNDIFMMEVILEGRVHILNSVLTELIKRVEGEDLLRMNE